MSDKRALKCGLHTWHTSESYCFCLAFKKPQKALRLMMRIDNDRRFQGHLLYTSFAAIGPTKLPSGEWELPVWSDGCSVGEARKRLECKYNLRIDEESGAEK